MTLAKALQAAAGNAGEAVYIDDTFSTYLYTGNGSTQTITNGIDLAGKGGLVWVKGRNETYYHRLASSPGPTLPNYLASNATDAASSGNGNISAFGSTGFTVNNNSGTGGTNSTGINYVSWTFREQAKFFDVVTYTGNDTAGRQIAHSLGSVPGCIIIKCTSTADNWIVYHRSIGNTKQLTLNTTDAQAGSAAWNSTDPTSTVFTLGSSTTINGSGRTYVAYLFAHDAGGFGADGSENVISCGVYTGSNTVQTTVNLGYEPQFVLIKNVTTAGNNWAMFDNMRGVATGGVDAQLIPNSSGAEVNTTDWLSFTSTGFQLIPLNNGTVNRDANNYIYIAIRRPMKPPESGTGVFTPTTYTGNGTSQVESAGFPTDMAIITNRGAGGGYERNVGDRLRGGNRTLFTTLTVAESTATNRITAFDNMVGVAVGSDGDVNQSSGSQIAWNFKRASGFFDVVCLQGQTGGRTVNHNLTVSPEFVISKVRNLAGTNWGVFHKDLGLNAYILINSVNSSATLTNSWNPSATDIYFNQAFITSNPSYNVVAYLFATYPGVSKVGSYTGNGSSQTINCGFTSGARFVLIKATSTTGNWIVADSARGINGSTDPALYLNSTAAEVTGFDWIDADSSGFIVNETATIAANTNGVTYIYLAIA